MGLDTSMVLRFGDPLMFSVIELTNLVIALVLRGIGWSREFFSGMAYTYLIRTGFELTRQRSCRRGLSS